MFRHFYLAILIIFLSMQSAFSSIIKYDRLFEKRAVSKSENTVELYDSNDIVKQIIIDERAHEVEEWWK